MAGFDSKVVSLLHFDDETKFDKVDGNAWTVGGAPTFDASNVKMNKSSLGLNGSSYVKLNKPLTGIVNDFTFEWWEFRTSTPNYAMVASFGRQSTASGNGILLGYVEGTNNVCYIGSDGGSWNVLSAFNLGSIDLNQWNHFAFVRAGNVFYGFKNGKLTSTFTSVNGLNPTFNMLAVGVSYTLSGNYFVGNVDEFRVSNVARYTSDFVMPTTRFNVDANTLVLLHMERPIFVDEVGVQWDYTNIPSVSTAQAKFGGRSLCLTGENCLTAPTGQYLNFDNKNFTIDWWEFRTASYDYATSFEICYGDGFGIAALQYHGNMTMMIGSSASRWDIAEFANMGSIDLNKWVHFAIVRSGSTFFMFKNGEVVNKVTSALPVGFNSSSIVIGDYRWNQTTSFNLTGYVDEFRISKGVARWTSNFTPPSEPYSRTRYVTIDNNGVAHALIDSAWVELGKAGDQQTIRQLLSTNNAIDAPSVSDLKSLNTNIVKQYILQENGERLLTASTLAIPNTQFIYELSDVDLKQVAYIDWVKVNDGITEFSGAGVVRHVVSRDSGVTWWTYDQASATWLVVIETTKVADGVVVDGLFKPTAAAVDRVVNLGITSAAISQVPFQAWTIDAGYKQLRFGHVLQLSSTADTALIDSIKYQCDGIGDWNLACPRVDYNVKTRNNSHAITWLSSIGGKRVKVNY